MPKPELNGGPWRGLPAAGTAECEQCIAEIRAALPELTHQQAAVALGVWAGLENKEIGGWLGLATGTVHQHCHSGMSRLKERLLVVRRLDLALQVERAFNRSADTISRIGD